MPALNKSLTTLKEYNTVKLNSLEVKVLQYLPISDKIDIVQIALQKSEEGGTYNELLLDMYFHLHIIFCYTDLEFSEEDLSDLMELYDRLESHGFVNEIIEAMNDDEYNNLRDYLDIMKMENLKYKNTAAAVISRIVQDLPRNAEAAKEILDTFDPQKYQEVINFATAANGGRNINTQTVPFTPPAQEIEEEDIQDK